MTIVAKAGGVVEPASCFWPFSKVQAEYE